MQPDKPPLSNTVSVQPQKDDQVIPCHLRKIPLWLVLFDNVPTLLLFIMGCLIISHLTVTGAILFGIYALFSVVWFWARICPYCNHYNTQACPCGYGAVSPLMFKKKDVNSFKKVFKRNILVVFPNWFIPLAISVYLISARYSQEILIQTIIFVVIGFIIIPVISKVVGCRNCAIKEDCPWMTITRKA